MAMLSAGCPEAPHDQLEALSIGERDALLLQLRELTLGGTLEGFARCPSCVEPLEFAMAASELQGGEAGLAPLELETDGFRVEFRLPDSRDVAAAAAMPDLLMARGELASRCIMQLTRNGAVAQAGELPEFVIASMGERMAECDPRAEVLLSLSCPSCRHAWQELFDIASFFWAELAAEARRVLWQVHALARAYGWRESDILALSARRRSAYLEMVGA